MTDIQTLPPAEVLRAFDNERLQLIVLPTEKCNFRCTYCYEDFDIGRMSDTVVGGIKALLDRRLPTLKFLEIGWFGGEPLLAKRVIYDVLEHVVAAQASLPALTYDGHITTNGYFLDVGTAKALLGLGMRTFQVSLDGPPEVHDRTRLLAGGGGTFGRIWSNLVDLKSTDLPLKIVLRLHYSPATLENVRAFLPEIAEEFAGDGRFSVFLKSVEHLGGPNDHEFTTFGSQQAQEIEAELIALIRFHGMQVNGSSPGKPAYVCYASKANSLMIRADGSLGKCTVALSDDRNVIGRLTPDGRVEIDQAKFRPWLSGFTTMDADQLGCPYSVMSREDVGRPSAGNSAGVMAPVRFRPRR